jgi:hypothetical protein
VLFFVPYFDLLFTCSFSFYPLEQKFAARLLRVSTNVIAVKEHETGGSQALARVTSDIQFLFFVPLKYCLISKNRDLNNRLIHSFRRLCYHQGEVK